ncbi:MAG: C45 family autoproteolytic acyltransferase/hydrolase [Pirellulaceae bacterium]|nr:C45 family autoproteolytic acyltransferase/hydrolase [Pirellulaceae bacterium]
MPVVKVLLTYPIFLVCVALLCPLAVSDETDETPRLARDIAPWIECISGRNESFSLQGKANLKLDGKLHELQIHFDRFNDDAFDLQLTHSDYAVHFRRRIDGFAMALPKHHSVYLGSGELDDQYHLRPLGLTKRVIGPGTSVFGYSQLLANTDAPAMAALLLTLTQLAFDESTIAWRAGTETSLKFLDEGRSVLGEIDGHRIDFQLGHAPELPTAFDDWPEMEKKDLSRAELERQLCRGLRRAFEVASPSNSLTSPRQAERNVEHGRLRWIDGNRVVLLHGTPQEIGDAHGKLLKTEAMRCVDSVINMFGTIQTVINGRWFREDLEAAYARLSPYIPERHKIETRALARSLNIDEQLLETTNVFPEFFHCSGFALYGDATVDGKLYHGRVLDYMTKIGLQDSATTFIVAPDGKIPFANVGYAGFIGSVSGMNAEKISLGEMGGAGEGKWDGAPMATLMRRALEECSSLDEVKQLWRDSPRTCEYYYVFADGETRTAVGVAATPESVEFVEPGQAHALLGEGISHAVVLSAGSRLEELRSRVRNQYGKIDAKVAQTLMCRPVAMSSNLHNVLFVPEDGVLYIANADHTHPAADRPYSKLDLTALLDSIDDRSKTLATYSEGSVFKAQDTLNPKPDSNADASKCVEGLCWKTSAFDVRIEKSEGHNGDWLVRFPSAMPTGNPINDLVALEWYQARDTNKTPIHAPAAIIVHESGSKMTVGRLIASGLRSKGVHTFMVQLPHYGARRGPNGKPNGEALVAALKQGISDVRRAKDAVATLDCVDASKISVQGTSLGGFVTATTAGLDDSFHRVFILLAGGDLHGVMMNGEREAAKMRADLTRAGIDDNQLKEILSPIEPLRLAHRLDPSKTWIFSGRYDSVVPLENVDRLAVAIGLDASHHTTMLADHYTGIIYLPMILQQIYDHMIEQ